MRFHHIAIIVSSENGVNFYKDLGFEEASRQNREYDQIVWLKGNCCTLEIIVVPTHPQRVSDPEANGLRHIAFEVKNLEAKREELRKYEPEEIRQDRRLFFVKEPDGQPIEFKEHISQPPEGDFSFEG